MVRARTLVLLILSLIVWVAPAIAQTLPCGGNPSCYSTCCGANRFCGSSADVCCYENRHLCGPGEDDVCVEVGCGFPTRHICGTYRYPTTDTCATVDWCWDAYQFDCYAQHACAPGEPSICTSTSCVSKCATYRTCNGLCPEPSTGLETDRMGLIATTSLRLTCSEPGCPAAPVSVQITVSNNLHGEVRGQGGGAFGSTATIVFPAGDPGPKAIEVRGKDAGAVGDQQYLLNLTATSADPAFDRRTVSVSVTNVDRIDTNACVPDVLAQFYNLPVPMNPLPIPFIYGTPLEYYCGDICTSHFEGTNRARRDSFLMISGTTGGASQLMSHWLWQKRGIKGSWGNNLSTWQDDHMANLTTYVVSPNYKHAGGVGLFGDFAAVPLEKDGSVSQVWFYDITRAYLTNKVGSALHRCDGGAHCYDKAGAVAVLKRGGSYLAAVMSNDPAEIHFYRSSGSDIRQPQTWTFLGAWSTQQHGYPSDCLLGHDLDATIQNMDFIEQCDGTVYLGAMYNTGTAGCTSVWGSNRLRLYEVGVDAILAGDTEESLTEVDHVDFDCNYGGDPHCTFAGGAGIYVSPETREMILYSQYWHTVLRNTHLGNTPFILASEFPFCPVEVPTGVTVSQGSFPDKVRISWAAVLNAAEYQVLRNGTVLGTTTGLYFDDVTLGSCDTASYAVRAMRCGHPSLPSTATSGWRSTYSAVNVPCDGPDGDLCAEGVFNCGANPQCSDISGTNQEVCNGQDDDCDGQNDEGLAGQIEWCNSIDDNCDGLVDAKCTLATQGCPDQSASVSFPAGPTQAFCLDEGRCTSTYCDSRCRATAVLSGCNGNTSSCSGGTTAKYTSGTLTAACIGNSPSVCRCQCTATAAVYQQETTTPCITCGNGICDGDETCDTCPMDCPYSTINLPRSQCAICDTTGQMLCGPGIFEWCCPNPY